MDSFHKFKADSETDNMLDFNEPQNCLLIYVKSLYSERKY